MNNAFWNMYVIKVACRVKGNMTWTTKQQLLSIILAKKLKPLLFRNMKGKWKTWKWKYTICAFKFGDKNDVILLKNSVFCELQVPIELVLWFVFPFSIFILRESSKQYLIFSYFYAVFQKSAMIFCQELSVIIQSHFKRIFDF